MLGWGYSGAGRRRICREKDRGCWGVGTGGRHGQGQGSSERLRSRARAPPRPARRSFPWGADRLGPGRCLCCCRGSIWQSWIAMGSTPFAGSDGWLSFLTGFYGKLKHLHRFAERNIDESFLIILRFKFRYDKFFFRLLWITIESELLQQIREPILLKWTMIHPYCLKQTYKQIPKFIFETQRNCENGLS